MVAGRCRHLIQMLLFSQVASALAARHIGGAVNYVAGAKLLADAFGQCNTYLHPHVHYLLTWRSCNALQWLKQPA